MAVKRPYGSFSIEEGTLLIRSRAQRLAAPFQSSTVRYGFMLSFGLLFVCLYGLSPFRGDMIPLDIEAQWNPHLLPGDNPYFKTGSASAHNEEVSARLDRCASLGLLRETANPNSLPELDLHEEGRYTAEGCGIRQTTVILLSSLWFTEAYQGSSTTGEGIWAQSVLSALNHHGYSYMFSSMGWYNNDMNKTIEIWDRHKKNIRLVLADAEQVDTCWNGEQQPCRKTATNPGGIEVWRLLSFWYWDNPRGPLGAPFTLSPFPRNDNHFLSLSIEPTCHRYPHIAPSSRPKPPQAYLLAKQMHYLEDSPEFAWTIPALANLNSSLGISVVGGMVNDDGDTAAAVEAAGLKNLGQLGKIEFYKELARSFVLIGVGRPKISPSPWDALCMGVPFINPILEWDENDPEDRSKWVAQSWHMTDLHPPYVYSVKARDVDGLREAVHAALTHPIKSYIPDNMSFKFVTDRLHDLVEGDWRGKAQAILIERLHSGWGEMFVL